MHTKFFHSLVDRAAAPYRQAGRFAYHFARGKLGHDSLFRHLLETGAFPSSGHFLDLGCGQAVFAALLVVARAAYEQGQWPADWPPPPEVLSLHGIELMDSDVRRAHSVFAAKHPRVHIRQGDICQQAFPPVDVLTILDVFQYIEYSEQEAILSKVRAALPPGGLFVTRIGDADAGLPFHLCNWVDQAVTFTRGHRLPKLYCRPLNEWRRLLQAHGFEVETAAMSHGKPFANVMLLARVPAVHG